jgi:hypothetical protein
MNLKIKLTEGQQCYINGKWWIFENNPIYETCKWKLLNSKKSEIVFYTRANDPIVMKTIDSKMDAIDAFELLGLNISSVNKTNEKIYMLIYNEQDDYPKCVYFDTCIFKFKLYAKLGNLLSDIVNALDTTNNYYLPF